jgi:hypothetical protein
MKLLALLLFVISNIQEKPAIWAILLFKIWPTIIYLNQVSIIVYTRHICTLKNKAIWDL